MSLLKNYFNFLLSAHSHLYLSQPIIHLPKISDFRFLLQEWGSSCPHEFIGAYRLEHDMTWTLAKDFERRGEEYKIVQQLLSKHASLEYFPDSKMEGMVKNGVIPDKPSSGE